jgi:hypothetical protein
MGGGLEIEFREPVLLMNTLYFAAIAIFMESQ